MTTLKFKNRKIFNIALDILSKNQDLIYDIGFSDMLIAFPTHEMYNNGFLELSTSSEIDPSNYDLIYE